MISLVQLHAVAMHATPTKHFINLSNGAEALPLLEAAKLPAEHISFCRIQSSHCEAQDFNGVLSNLDHNLLMHLALGFDCCVYDFGSRGNYWAVNSGGADVELDAADENAGLLEEPLEPRAELQYVPRAVWWGMEWSRYALNTIWHLEVRPPLLRGYNVQTLFDAQIRAIPKPLWKRLKYYRAYTAPSLREINLRGFYAQTELDGNKEAYREFMLGYAERASGSATRIDPMCFKIPMRAYDAQTAVRVGEMRGRSSS